MADLTTESRRSQAQQQNSRAWDFGRKFQRLRRKNWFTNLYRPSALPISAVFPLRYTSMMMLA
jgi:hypothetical protein